MAAVARTGHLTQIGLTTPDAQRLTTFYERAFGARCVARERVAGAEFERLLRIDGGAWRYRLQLGSDTIELLMFDQPGRAYPTQTRSDDLLFQHFAIVVSDLPLAVQRLDQTPEWAPISSAPQRLPQSSGGVMAYKFRDPDGHPLELLQFPAASRPPRWRRTATPSLVYGIDHSAISVARTAASVAFLNGLGFAVSSQGTNTGAEQARLDGIADPQVVVTALELDGDEDHGPHIELLCYRTDVARPPIELDANDVAATRIIIDTHRPAELVFDPDGHRIQLGTVSAL